MEPTDQDEARQRRLDYNLWYLGQVATDARQTLANQYTELRHLRTLCNAQSESLQQSWNKCQELVEALQAQSCKSQQLAERLDQVTRDLHDEGSRTEGVKRSFAEYWEKPEKHRQTMQIHGEGSIRYLTLAADIQERRESVWQPEVKPFETTSDSEADILAGTGQRKKPGTGSG